MLRTSTRMDAVQAPIVPILGDMIRRSPGTISLGQGVVHYGPPRASIEAVRAALDHPGTHDYNDGAGTPELVARITAKLREENSIDVSRGSRVMVTAGANMAFMHAVTAITGPGDEIILNVPFYFNHEMAVQMAGCVPVRVATDERYQPRPDALRRAITDRTRAIVTISPNNPSGAVYSEGALREVNALCAERGLYHVADEVYEYFTYGAAAHVSPGSFPGAAAHTISMYSLSKAYGFAGWRIGYLVYPEHLAEPMLKIQDTVLICATVASQIAAVAALNVGRAHSAPHVKALDELRHIVVSKLSELGSLATIPAADGAFYVLLKVNTSMAPLALVDRLIREHKVAAVPGPAFGMTDGCYLRVAYGALQRETVAEGIGRLVTGLKALA